jgi:hypothetical protein
MKMIGHRKRRDYLAPCLVLLAWGGTLCAQPGPPVVELFTSEGCSSCPPAEALLGRLASAGVIALAWHVDYWDSLGWRDRFALPEADQRQDRYAGNLHLASVYTPQAVIGGQRDVLGSDERAIRQSLDGVTSSGHIALSDSGGQIQVAVSATKPATAAVVLLVSYLREAHRQIGGGENSGRELREFNIVRSVRALGSWTGSAALYQFSRASLPADATDIVVMLQADRQGAIQSAATLSLR